MTMTKNLDAPSNLLATDVSTAATRSKAIGAKLRQQRSERDGVIRGGLNPKQMRRLPNEETAERNQRILHRYIELKAAQGGKARGIPVQLGREFDLSPQYIRRDVITPFLQTKATSNRR